MCCMVVEVVECNGGVENFVFVGICICGVLFVDFMVKEIEKVEGVLVLQGIFDIMFYCDDLLMIVLQLVVKESYLLEVIEGVIFVFCDDVFYIGCMICVVFDVFMDYGCLKVVQFVVFIDCGYCELLIQVDFIGQQIQMLDIEVIKVIFVDIDDGDENVRFFEVEFDFDQGGV